MEGSNGRTVFIKFSKVGHREMKSLKIPILQEYYEEGKPADIFGNPQKAKTKEFLSRFIQG